MKKFLVSAVVGALVATFVAVLPAGPAQAHGNVISPASRNYGCFIRWGDHFLSPGPGGGIHRLLQLWAPSRLPDESAPGPVVSAPSAGSEAPIGP